MREVQEPGAVEQDAAARAAAPRRRGDADVAQRHHAVAGIVSTRPEEPPSRSTSGDEEFGLQIG
jgi:hypothetical protein